MKTFMLLFFDSFTKFQFEPVEKSIYTFNEKGRLTNLLVLVPDLRPAHGRILSPLPSVQKAYIFESKILKNSKS